jgi:uncharacterized protein YndB with AHSA1/START domain
MSIFIGILSAIVLLIMVFLVVALFSKKGYTIEREIAIIKPKQEVFNYIKLLKNQDHFSKWVMRDPQMKKEFKGTDGTPGFTYAWDSEDKGAGKGEQEIKKVAEGERIDMEIRFEKPFKGISETYMTTENAGDHRTKVKWVFSSQLKYPMNLMLIFVNFEKLLGKDLEASLATLRTNLEK